MSHPGFWLVCLFVLFISHDLYFKKIRKIIILLIVSINCSFNIFQHFYLLVIVYTFGSACRDGGDF